jgi:hypothetical protein
MIINHNKYNFEFKSLMRLIINSRLKLKKKSKMKRVATQK